MKSIVRSGVWLACCLVPWLGILPVDAEGFDPHSLTYRTAPALPSLDIPGDSDPTGTSQDENKNFLDVAAPPYRAVADGTTDDTDALAAALRDAAKAAKATGVAQIVVLKSGTFLSGPLALGSHVYLKVEAGATLKALPMEAYRARATMDQSGTHSGDASAKNSFLSNAGRSKGNTDLGIYGGGVIDGNGGNGVKDYAVFSKDPTSWWGNFKINKAENAPRPRALYFSSCTNLLVRDITIENSPAMHFVASGGRHLVLSNVTIQAPAVSEPGDGGTGTSGDSPNTDGFDPAGSSSGPCTDIWVDHCTFDTGDDCIAVKADANSVSNLYVTNCTFRHGHGLSLGGQTTEGISNLIVDHCTFVATQAGIKIKSGRPKGGDCHDLQYSNLTMTAVLQPIWFTSYYPNDTYLKMPASNEADHSGISSDGMPYYHRILVENVTVAGATAVGLIVGLPGSVFDDIVLNHVTIAGAPNGLTVRNALVSVSNDSVLPPPILQEQSAWNRF